MPVRSQRCSVVVDQPRTVIVRLQAAPLPDPADPDRCHGLSCTPTISEIIHTGDAPARSLPLLLLVILLFAFIGFPAALFNSTYAENEGRITHKVRSWLRLQAPREVRPTSLPLIIGLVAVGALYALDANDGASTTQFMAIVFGLALSFAAVTLAMQMPEALVAGRPPRYRGTIRILPTGIAVAALCVGVSHLLDLHPGYVYGAVATFTVISGQRPERDRRRAAPIAVASLAVTTAVALILWSVTADWIRGPEFPALPRLIVAEFAVGLVLASAESMVFDFLPVKFLQGEHLWAWSKRWWTLVAVASLTLCGLIVTRMLSAGGEFNISSEQLASAYAAVFAFGLLSVLFWNYFRVRSGRFGATEDEVESEPASEAA